MVRVPRLAGLFLRIALVSTLALAFPRAASAQIVTGSDGSDGAFTFVPDTPGGSTMTIDLALAASGLDGQGQPITWQTPSPVAGRGVYDPFAWVVVFKYSSVVVPVGKIIKFANHGSRAPVVWLVQNTCTIAGTINLDGVRASGTWPEPGPGGFRGGASYGQATNLGGLGPGGSMGSGVAVIANGSDACFPLVGGSGTGTKTTSCTTTASGAGAILIAAGMSIDVPASGNVYSRATDNYCASEGQYSGGGKIRLVSQQITKTNGADFNAYGIGGRIRFETPSFIGTLTGTPTPTLSTQLGQLLPDATTATVRVVSITVNGQAFTIPADPRASPYPTQADAVLPVSGTATVLLEARNVTPGLTPWLRALNVAGAATAHQATPLVGTQALSTATVSLTLTPAVYALQARVVL